MNLTENELKGLPLEEQQKIVVELSDIRPGDRAYPNAKAIVEFITGLKKYKAPEKIKVVATENIPVDGRDVKRDQEIDVYPWQYRALARFFSKVGGVAAAIFGLLFFECDAASGQTTFAGQQYSAQYVAGYNGGTNAMASATTNLLWVPVITTNSFTNTVITISNGTPVFTTVTNTTTTTNIPAMITLTRSSEVAVRVSVQGASGLVTTNLFTVPFYACLDGGTNAWLAFTLQGIANSNSVVTVGTNYHLGAAGYLLPWSIGNAGTNWLTNLVIQASAKPSLTGL